MAINVRPWIYVMRAVSNKIKSQCGWWTGWCGRRWWTGWCGRRWWTGWCVDDVGGRAGVDDVGGRAGVDDVGVKAGLIEIFSLTPALFVLCCLTPAGLTTTSVNCRCLHCTPPRVASSNQHTTPQPHSIKRHSSIANIAQCAGN